MDAPQGVQLPMCRATAAVQVMSALLLSQQLMLQSQEVTPQLQHHCTLQLLKAGGL